MKQLRPFFSSLWEKSGILVFIIVSVIAVPFSVHATPNVYTWTNQTGSGSKMWKGIAGSSDLSKLAAVELSGGHIYTSSNSGVSWTVQSNAGTHSWLGITSSPDGTKLAAISNITGNVFTSSDSGVNWTQRNGAGTRNWTAITSALDGAEIIAAAYSEGIYISTTTGSTWTVATNAGSRNWQAVTSSSDGTKLAAVVNPGAIYLSSDGGTNWTTASASSSAAWQSITSSSDGTKLAAVVHGGYIYTSSDSGATWATSSAPYATWQSVTSSSDGARLAAAVDTGDIYTSSDGGTTWTDQTLAGSRIWYSIVSSTDGSKLAATAYNGDIWTGSLDISTPSITLDPNFTNIHLGPNATHFSSKVTDDQAVSSVQFFLNGVAYGSAVTPPVSDDLFSTAFDPSGEAEGTYTLSVVAEDTTGNYATSSDQTFYIIHTPAVLSEVTAVPNTVTNSSVTYSYSASFSTANDNGQTVVLSSCGNGSQSSSSAVSSNSTNTVSISGLVVGDTYQCTLKVRDVAGNESNTLTIGPFRRVESPAASGVNNLTGGIVWGCKDPNAANYNYFSASDPSLCRYTNSMKPPSIPSAPTVTQAPFVQIPTSAPVQTLVSNSNISTSPLVSSTSQISLHLTSDLIPGMSTPEVTLLQNYLINLKSGPAAESLSKVGTTGFYGEFTYNAVKELQIKAGITPVTGQVGSKTRAYLMSGF